MYRIAQTWCRTGSNHRKSERWNSPIKQLTKNRVWMPLGWNKTSTAESECRLGNQGGLRDKETLIKTLWCQMISHWWLHVLPWWVLALASRFLWVSIYLRELGKILIVYSFAIWIFMPLSPHSVQKHIWCNTLTRESVFQHICYEYRLGVPTNAFCPFGFLPSFWLSFVFGYWLLTWSQVS